MRAIIGAKLLSGAMTKPTAKPFEVNDTRLSGFILRVQPSGARSYYAQVGRSQRVALGKVGVFTPDEARERCEKVLGNVAHGRPPLHGLDGTQGPSLGEFVTDTYAPWAKAHLPRTSQQTLDRVQLHFSKWFSQPIASITVVDVENWRIKRVGEGVKPTTVRRDLDSLASVLTRAVKHKHIAENVVRQVERPRIDRTPKVRYLDSDEEQRLRQGLGERDKKMQGARRSHNRWLKARGQDIQSDLPHFGDHLSPAVLISMNTGVRRGELLALRWTSVDFKLKQITIEGSTAKSQQTRHIPLNAEALEALKHWREQAPDGERVFAIVTGFKSSWAPMLLRAGIRAFRWHDLRHHFASRLVQAGVPLNTVRDLLGHASMAMTLRYAHLAPDQKREAVAKLAEVRK